MGTYEHSGSIEKMPPGKNRCPRCRKLHDIESSKVGGKHVLSEMEEQMLAMVGMKNVRLRCPHCSTTYELQYTPEDE